MKRIKVLRIIARLNIGGPAIHTILLTEGLDKNRFESVLVCGRPGENEGDMAYLAQEKGIRFVIIPELSWPLNIRNDIISFWKIFCLIRREKPDIIHTHTAKAGTLGRLAALLYKFAYVPLPIGRANTTYHLKLIHTFHGHFFHSYFSRMQTISFLWIEKFLALFTTKIVTVSENLKKELLDLKIAPPDKFAVVPLGLELDSYLKIENNGPRGGEHKAIGIIGRLVPIKNHKMFLDVIKRFKQTRGFNQKVKFLIVGDGPLRRHLEDYAEQLEIKEDVSFLGWMKDLAGLYSQLDIVALTSLNEGTPVALIEAQAAARPCVATNVGGVANVIEEGKNGFLVPTKDVEKFAQSLINLLDHPELMKTMGEYGREKVKYRFNKERLFKDIEKLYLQESSGKNL